MSNLSHVQRVRILYKTILRLHRGLPAEIQAVGTSYVQDEFRRHKNCDEATTAIFLKEWTEYAIMLTKQLGLKGPHTAKPLGKNLKKEDLDKFRNEQMYQLYELMIAATGKTNNDGEDK
ncbi:succinate dehydrogenase assembly factor 3, mitochondrial [Bombus affinis]|uniref:Succinate dehydrogenase assembly factor 3 n=1 Tax=Bombus terrestris TaxID=30195 RepID=A0A9B0C205_BOMTE|nr:succinate dehydrogenase assembly factor 3, mitochondrial [Bombus terrestris]XP_048267545.1 succinate dehydrogenase assembly factor 3, mitochondrial [Bombus terrestris]XP_050591389.1 succinate dehydrogenase assembly factor 3, mitochondrial [Bombus affinis]